MNSKSESFEFDLDDWRFMLCQQGVITRAVGAQSTHFYWEMEKPECDDDLPACAAAASKSPPTVITLADAAPRAPLRPPPTVVTLADAALMPLPPSESLEFDLADLSFMMSQGDAITKAMGASPSEHTRGFDWGKTKCDDDFLSRAVAASKPPPTAITLVDAAPRAALRSPPTVVTLADAALMPLSPSATVTDVNMNSESECDVDVHDLAEYLIAQEDTVLDALGYCPSATFSWESHEYDDDLTACAAAASKPPPTASTLVDAAPMPPPTVVTLADAALMPLQPSATVVDASLMPPPTTVILADAVPMSPPTAVILADTALMPLPPAAITLAPVTPKRLPSAVMHASPKSTMNVLAVPSHSSLPDIMSASTPPTTTSVITRCAALNALIYRPWDVGKKV